MFEIRIDDAGTIHLCGRLDASQADKADGALNTITESTIADFSELDYISSAGLGVIVKAFKRLHDTGKTLRLVNMNQRIRNIFKYSGLDQVLSIE